MATCPCIYQVPSYAINSIGHISTHTRYETWFLKKLLPISRGDIIVVRDDTVMNINLIQARPKARWVTGRAKYYNASHWNGHNISRRPET